MPRNFCAKKLSNFFNNGKSPENRTWFEAPGVPGLDGSVIQRNKTASQTSYTVVWDYHCPGDDLTP